MRVPSLAGARRYQPLVGSEERAAEEADVESASSPAATSPTPDQEGEPAMPLPPCPFHDEFLPEPKHWILTFTLITSFLQMRRSEFAYSIPTARSLRWRG